MSAYVVAAHAAYRPSVGHRPPVRRSVGAAIAGGVGELFITVGLLLALFVVWQLWWTDVTAGRVQIERAQEVVQGWDAPPAPTGGAGAPAPTQHRDDVPVEPEPAFGTTFGQLYIPRFGPDYFTNITEGTDREKILNVYGAGHYENTAMPGGLGNFALAGHRTTYGKPFNLIADLVPGDALVVRTATTWYVYKVYEDLIVKPSQVEVISPIPGLKPGDPLPELTERFMTLTACHPMYSADERYIIHAKLDYWMPVTEGIPPEMDGVRIVGMDG
jgi:sortase A